MGLADGFYSDCCSLLLQLMPHVLLARAVVVRAGNYLASNWVDAAATRACPLTLAPLPCCCHPACPIMLLLSSYAAAQQLQAQLHHTSSDWQLACRAEPCGACQPGQAGSITSSSTSAGAANSGCNSKERVGVGGRQRVEGITRDLAALPAAAWLQDQCTSNSSTNTVATLSLCESCGAL